MRSLIFKKLVVGCVGMLLIGCEDVGEAVGPKAANPPAPSFTASSGVTATDFGPGGTIARATFDGFSVKRVATESHKRGWPHGRWEFGIEARPTVDVGVRSLEFAPGSFTGWHAHPGPVLTMVLEGTLTFYDSDDPECASLMVTAGEGFLDRGEHAHIGRNETDQQARVTVVLFAPEGVPFRIDAPDPGHCPFSS